MKTETGPINHREIEAIAAEWLARQDNGDAWHDDDEQALQAWLASSTAHRVAWLRLRQAWARADGLQRTSGETAEAHHAPMPQLPVRRRALRAMAGVAVAGLVAVSANVALKSRTAPAAEGSFVTAVGARKDLTLADGSQVTLNTRTTARIAVTGDRRQVALDQGEAFFNVRPDPRHPFVITAGADRITVLGTKFSVRHENNRTQVTVVEGRVRFERGGLAEGGAARADVVLTPNEVAVSRPDGVAVAETTPKQAQLELSWREGVLAFDNKPLAEIAAEFNRYNKRQIVVQGDAATLTLSGRFATNNVDGFVRLVDTGFGVSSREVGGKIYLSKK